MGHLILQGDNTQLNGFSLLGESTLAITFDDALIASVLDFLVLSGTTSVSIASNGFSGGIHGIRQLEEKDNVLTTVTISGSESFFLGVESGNSNSGDGVVTDIAATATSLTKIHSSLTLIDASQTTGELEIVAGATNTSGAGNFRDGASLNANVTITYTGLTIKGGLGAKSFIENDAKNGIVTDGNGHDVVVLGGAGAKAVLGTGSGDRVSVGVSNLGTNEAPGNALGDKVTFGSAATADLVVGTGAEAGSTAGTASIGLTKVLNAADGMKIDFSKIVLSSSFSFLNETAHVVGAANITTAENAAVANLGGPGVAFFTFGGNEYFIATNHGETAVSSTDAIVKLVGVHDLISPSIDIASGVVTLHV